MPTLDKLDAQQERNAIAKLNVSVVANGNVTGTPTLTFTGNALHTATMTGACTFTFAADANLAAGDTFILQLTQDGTGTRVATWPANFKKAGGTLTLTTTAAATDVIHIMYDGTNFHEVGRNLNNS